MATAADPLVDEHRKFKEFHNDRFSSQVRQTNRWQQIAFGMCGTTVLAVGGCVYLGHLPKTSTQVIEVDKGSGAVTFIGQSKESDLSNQVWDAAKKTAFSLFVTDWRTVTPDPVLRASYWDGSYDWVQKRSKAEIDLWRWFEAHNPKQRSADETVSVQINLGATGPVTGNTFQVWWSEVTFKNGRETSQEWHAVFTYRIAGVGQVKPRAGSYNGLGIFITDINGPTMVGEPKEISQ